jgi:hypothetical protein
MNSAIAKNVSIKTNTFVKSGMIISALNVLNMESSVCLREMWRSLNVIIDGGRLVKKECEICNKKSANNV